MSKVVIVFVTYFINPSVSSVRGTVRAIALRHFKLEILVFESLTFLAAS